MRKMTITEIITNSICKEYYKASGEYLNPLAQADFLKFFFASFSATDLVNLKAIFSSLYNKDSWEEANKVLENNRLY